MILEQILEALSSQGRVEQDQVMRPAIPRYGETTNALALPQTGEPALPIQEITAAPTMAGLVAQPSSQQHVLMTWLARYV
jgi:hypothetical protein